MTARYIIKNQVIRPLANTTTQTAQTALLGTYAALGQTSNTPTPVVEGDLNNFNHDYGEDGARTYWYHPDHLGSSSYITNVEDIVTQHMEYMPYGEPSLASSPTPKKTIATSGQSLVEEHQNSINTPYKFNGKEQDDETGNYYYGARYYNPKFSFWLSVDPLAEKGPHYSSYSYTFNSPIVYTDPDGRWPWPVIIRSFAPWPAFGMLNYEGDNRGYSSVMGERARITQSFNIDTDNYQICDVQTSSHSSYSYVAPILGRKTGKPRGNATMQKYGANDSYFEVSSNYHGSLPLHPGFEIDVYTTFRMQDNKAANELLIYGVQQVGDKFPTAETIIYDQENNGVIIGVAPAQGTSPERWVAGDSRRHMMSSGSLKISYNSKGVFTGVSIRTYGEDGSETWQEYSISDWNNLMKSQPLNHE